MAPSKHTGRNFYFTIYKEEIEAGLLLLPETPLRVWLFLRSKEGIKGKSWYSKPHIAEVFGMTKQAIIGAHKYLLKHGWLQDTGERVPSAKGSPVPVYKTCRPDTTNTTEEKGQTEDTLINQRVKPALPLEETTKVLKPNQEKTLEQRVTPDLPLEEKSQPSLTLISQRVNLDEAKGSTQLDPEVSQGSFTTLKPTPFKNRDSLLTVRLKDEKHQEHTLPDAEINASSDARQLGVASPPVSVEKCAARTYGDFAEQIQEHGLAWNGNTWFPVPGRKRESEEQALRVCRFINASGIMPNHS